MKAKSGRMHNPPHAGEVLQDTVLGALTVSDFARRLGVSRVINGRAAVSADMALRLADALGGSAESWLRLQASYDLWQASRKPRPKVELLKGLVPKPAKPVGIDAMNRAVARSGSGSNR